jgi:hypothetical protein
VHNCTARTVSTQERDIVSVRLDAHAGPSLLFKEEAVTENPTIYTSYLDKIARPRGKDLFQNIILTVLTVITHVISSVRSRSAGP